MKRMQRAEEISSEALKSLRDRLIKKLPNDRFFKKLLKGAQRVARDRSNPIRGNLAASALREIVGHILHTLAPDEEVLRCNWYEQAPNTRNPTRRQRAKYIVQAGLQDEFVQETLGIEVKENIQPLLEAMDVLNKATHVRAETIVHQSGDIRAMMYDVLSGVYSLMNAAEASREQIKRAIADKMHHAVLQNLISEYIQELDEISTHTSVDDHYIDYVEVSKMGPTHIEYLVFGQVEVELQYGSDSDVQNDIGFRMADSYPYSAKISSRAANPFDIHGTDVIVSIDNSSFFE